MPALDLLAYLQTIAAAAPQQPDYRQDSLMTREHTDERDAIKAATSRLLADTPLRSFREQLQTASSAVVRPLR